MIINRFGLTLGHVRPFLTNLFKAWNSVPCLASMATSMNSILARVEDAILYLRFRDLVKGDRETLHNERGYRRALWAGGGDGGA